MSNTCFGVQIQTTERERNGNINDYDLFLHTFLKCSAKLNPTQSNWSGGKCCRQHSFIKKKCLKTEEQCLVQDSCPLEIWKNTLFSESDLSLLKNTSYLWMKWSFHLIKDTQALHNCTICKKTRGIRFWKLRININRQWERRQLTCGRFLVLDKLQNILTTHFSNHPFDTIKTLGKVKTHASGFSQTHTHTKKNDASKEYFLFFFFFSIMPRLSGSC